MHCRSFAPLQLVLTRGLLFLFLALLPVAALAQNCDPNKPGPDSDNDGVPDCFDECPANPEKVIRDECGCEQIPLDLNADGVAECVDTCEFDAALPFGGVCECPLFDLLVQFIPGFGTGFQCEDRPALQRNTVIRQPPGVVVFRQPNGQSSVALMFQKFSFALSITRRPRSMAFQSMLVMLDATKPRISTQRYKVRYEATIEPIEPRGALIRKTSKRNQLTVNGLGAGSYTVKYRAAALAGDDVVFRSKFSPVANFVVP